MHNVRENHGLLLFVGCIAGVLSAFFIPNLTSASTIHIDVVDSSFSPKDVTIAPGDTVVWTNRGAMIHTVTADNQSFNSGNISPGQTYTQSFTAPGTYPYYCIPHGNPGGQGMAGTIRVTAASLEAQEIIVQPVDPKDTEANNPDSLREEILSLLKRINELQTRIGEAGGPVVSPNAPALPPAAPVSGNVQCPLISRTLKLGSQGDDVARLQRYLSLDPSVYPEAKVTGYYGALTEAAVKRWQVKFHIVSSGTPGTTGFGIVGPRTAAILALQCPDRVASNVGGFIKVNPVTGPAPLSVTVEATVNTTKSCTGATYEVDFGDRSPAATIVVPAGACSELRQVFTRRYPFGGTYSVTLRSGTHQTAATVTVSGSGGGSTSSSGGRAGGGTGSAGSQTSYGGLFSVSPRSPDDEGAVAVTAEFDLRSSCTAYELDWGEGGAPDSQSEGTCSPNPTTKRLTNTYEDSGSYTLTLRRGTQGAIDTASIIISD